MKYSWLLFFKMHWCYDIKQTFVLQWLEYFHKLLWHSFHQYEVRLSAFQPLTSMTCKIMEQIPLEYMSQHMEDMKVIRDSQHGFTEHKLCLTNPVSF